MRKVKILGPTDRYNYGDLLFPLIIKKHLAKTGIEVENYALVDSDLSSYNALKTQNITTFYNNLSDNDNIVIAGGESLCATWGDLYSYLNSSFSRIASPRISRALDRRIPITNCGARKLARGKTEYPFSFCTDELGVEANISLNAVGGSALSTWSDARKAELARKLSKHEIVSVRDMVTYRELEKTNILHNLSLHPDTAILMKELLGDEMQKFACSHKNTQIIGEEYIFFQVGAEKAESLSVIHSELSKILASTSLDLVLCPIGHAYGHEDFKPLGILFDSLTKTYPGRVIFFREMKSVFEVMHLISKSRCYIGTSLHGAITALSFGVPYATFNLKIKKLTSFLQTWGCEGLKEHFETAKIHKGFSNAIEHRGIDILSGTTETKKKALQLLNSYTSAASKAK
ncbi:polysaccharide pyruvyl transferase family protein [Halopseudomonas pachastrellae]|nr:polysaccharide pyruvyl transferase family protein [Halopseudomonas pachastrellae]